MMKYQFLIIYNHFVFKYDDKESEIKFTKEEGLPIVFKPSDEAWFFAQPTDDSSSYIIYHPGQADSILNREKPLYIAIAYSQAAEMDNYEVTGEHLDTITKLAREHKGCLGARMTGAGFGGCAIAIVKKDSIEEFKKSVISGYSKALGITCDIFECEIPDGVSKE